MLLAIMESDFDWPPPGEPLQNLFGFGAGLGAVKDFAASSASLPLLTRNGAIASGIFFSIELDVNAESLSQIFQEIQGRLCSESWAYTSLSIS